jgi:hypothetical protein
MVNGIGSVPGATDSTLRKAPSRTIFDSTKTFRVALLRESLKQQTFGSQRFRSFSNRSAMDSTKPVVTI